MNEYTIETELAQLKRIPKIIRKFVDIEDHDDSTTLFPFMSLEGLSGIRSDDMVGFVSSGECASVGMPLNEAVDRLRGAGGYVTGWEYIAGGQYLSPLFPDLESAVSNRSWLAQLYPMAVELESVMKWMFISCGGRAASEWHTDPIGSCAWMVMLVGEKKWTVRVDDGMWEEILRPGDLLLLPSGLEHKVENRGDGLNVAVSHNWIDRESLGSLWKVLEEGLRDVATYLSVESDEEFFNRMESFREEHGMDNLLFGLIMVLVCCPEERLSGVITRESIRGLIDQIRRVKLDSVD
jgi:hypothetical protein